MSGRGWAAPSLARRLAAPPPTWSRSADVVVVGTGVAGLTAALVAARSGQRVLLLTKGELSDGSTCWAQGGVAAAMAPGDSPERHFRDTVDAGAGLCDPTAVRALVAEGRQAVLALADLGARFDSAGGPGNGQSPPGGQHSGDAGRTYAFTREGGHSLARVVHAGGDSTGREVQRALQRAVDAADGIEVWESAFALDLVRTPAGAAAGLTIGLLDRTGAVTSVGTVRAPAIALATGGFGQLFATTSNPEVATGDGLALALRAGAEVADLEFVQFHPTVLYSGETGRRLLVSEALRGEGATLVDATGARVMAGQHPLEDLAPRDVVSSAIARRLAAAPGGVRNHVYLDARGLGEPTLNERFPTIVAGCREAGVDPVTEPIPVAPAAHYACGGVSVDVAGRTSVPGLYAVGEVACTGVHGANRLASNSLLEGLVMGNRVAGELVRCASASAAAVSAAARPEAGRGGQPGPEAFLLSPAARDEMAIAMSRYAGVVRDGPRLASVADVLARLASEAVDHAAVDLSPGRASWEATNVHAVATALVAAARVREETRGCHVRTDHPASRSEWARHLVMTVAPDGTFRHRRAARTRLDPGDQAA